MMSSCQIDGFLLTTTGLYKDQLTFTVANMQILEWIHFWCILHKDLHMFDTETESHRMLLFIDVSLGL